MLKAADKSRGTNLSAAPWGLRWQCHLVFLAMLFQLSEEFYMQTDFHWIYPCEQCTHLFA